MSLLVSLARRRATVVLSRAPGAVGLVAALTAVVPSHAAEAQDPFHPYLRASVGAGATARIIDWFAPDGCAPSDFPPAQVSTSGAIDLSAHAAVSTAACATDGSATASGSARANWGHLGAGASASARGTPDWSTEASGGGTAIALDWFTVGGAGIQPVQIDVTSVLHAGSTVSGACGADCRRMSGTTSASLRLALFRTYTDFSGTLRISSSDLSNLQYATRVDQGGTTTAPELQSAQSAFSVTPGERFGLWMQLVGSAGADAWVGAAEATLDAMHTGRLFVGVGTPGATLTSDTGTSYSAAVVSPEPASLVLVATGAGGVLLLAAVRRRRA